MITPLIAAPWQTVFRPLLLCVFLGASIATGLGAVNTNETQLINTLQSTNATLAQKSGACAELKFIGTERSIKALAVLLTDEQLSISARNALETMPSSQAGKALLKALNKTSGNTQAGIIYSLALRHESDAVGDLAKLLRSPNETVAIASANALGEIGGSTALKRLQSAAPASEGALHEAEASAILSCAFQLLDADKPGDALKVFKKLHDTESGATVRQAAFGGIILASGDQGASIASDAIINGDAASRAIALHLAAKLKSSAATRELADLAVAAKTPVQLALIACLVQRNDPAAMTALTRLADGGDDSVRLAAITALGALGDDSAIKLLVEKAAGTTGTERDAARQSLVDLNRGPVTKHLVELADSASPKVKSEIILALGARGDQAATPALLNLARHGNENERTTALQAIGQLADASHIPDLVQMVATSESDDARAQAADALEGIYQRMPQVTAPDAEALVKEIKTGTIETRLALLPICSEISQPAIRDALRALLADTDARTRDAAIHALCETHDPALLPDLLDLAGGKSGDAARHLAVRGAVHLVAQEDDVKLPNDKKLDAFSRLIAGTPNAGDKRLVLSGLETVIDRPALVMASHLLDDSDVRPEAEQAVIHLAIALKNKNPQISRDLLSKILASTSSETNRKTIQDALKK